MNNTRSISFATADKTIQSDWDSLGVRLTLHLTLLKSAKRVKQFSHYLRSAVFANTTRVGRLFGIVEPHYLARNTKPLAVPDLLAQAFNTASYEEHGKEALSLLSSVPRHIKQFIALSHVYQDKLETSAMAVAAIRHQGHPDLYRRFLRHWTTAIGNADLGWQRTHHSWAVEDAKHNSFDIPKDSISDGNFKAAYRSLLLRHHFEKLVYESELENRRNIFSADALIEEVQDTKQPLDDLFNLLIELQRKDQPDVTMYFQLKKSYLSKVPQLDGELLYIFFSRIQNLLISYTRISSDFWFHEELYNWTTYLLEEKLHERFPVIPRAFLLNRLETVFLHQDVAAARELLDVFGPRLPEYERQYAELHTEISMAFHSHYYAGVIKVIPDHHREAWQETYMDRSRFKSYRLRACLCLYARSLKIAPDIELALKDFDDHLQVKGKDMNEERLRSLELFLVICKKIYGAMSSGSLEEDIPKLKNEIERHSPLHADRWLLSFLYQVDPARKEEYPRIKPNPLWVENDARV